MDPLIKQALRANHSAQSPHRNRPGRRVLVLGGGGSLGSAVLEQLLARRGTSDVQVATVAPLQAGLQGLSELRLAGEGPWPALQAHAAVLVFDHLRWSARRDEAFWMPAPEQLLEVGRWLHAQGVPTLVVVMPHAPASLPVALRRGLANLDEQALAMLGFDHLLFVRSAQRPTGATGGSLPQRVARWMLGQLHLMVPDRDRPVRPHKVAEFVQQALVQLPLARPGTWVAAPELVWQASQEADVDRLVQSWLHPASATPA